MGKLGCAPQFGSTEKQSWAPGSESERDSESENGCSLADRPLTYLAGALLLTIHQWMMVVELIFIHPGHSLDKHAADTWQAVCYVKVADHRTQCVFFFFFFLETEGPKGQPQIFRRVDRRFHGRGSNRQPPPFGCGYLSTIIRSSRTKHDIV